MADFLKQEEINSLLDEGEMDLLKKQDKEEQNPVSIQITFKGIKIETDEFVKKILKENWKYCKEATIKEI